MENRQGKPDIHHYGKKLEWSRRALTKEPFEERDKQLIREFLDFIEADGVSPGRLTKYCYTLMVIRRQMNCTFEALDRAEAERLMRWINGSGYKAWTKSDLKGALKRFVKWVRLRSLDNSLPFPPEVAWIRTTLKRNELEDPEILNDHEVEAMIAAAKSPRDRASRSEAATKAWETRRKQVRSPHKNASLTDANAWYWGFIHQFGTEDGGSFKGWGTKGGTDAQWTKYIERVLMEWGAKEGYTIKHDHASPVRIDLSWLKNGRTEVAIEHENMGDNTQSPINREVEKLVQNSQAPLRVLITYFKESNFVEGAAKLRDLVLKQIRTTDRFDFEFLLMVAPYSILEPEEFVAYAYRPRVFAEFVPPAYD